MKHFSVKETIIEATIPTELFLVSHCCYWQRFCIAAVAALLLIRRWLCMLNPTLSRTPPLLPLLRSHCALKLDVACALTSFPLLYYSSTSTGTCYSRCSCWCSSDTVLLGWLELRQEVYCNTHKHPKKDVSIRKKISFTRAIVGKPLIYILY
jgi:hypothetical protein